MATREEVASFLSNFITKGKMFGIYFRGDRLKNRQTLADLEISAMQREEEVLTLKTEYYSSGPTEDRLNHGEDVGVRKADQRQGGIHWANTTIKPFVSLFTSPSIK